MAEPVIISGRLPKASLVSAMKLAREQRRVALDTITALFDGVEVPDSIPANAWWLITKVEVGQQFPDGLHVTFTAVMIVEPNPHGFATGGVVAALPHIVGETPSETTVPKDRLL